MKAIMWEPSFRFSQIDIKSGAELNPTVKTNIATRYIITTIQNEKVWRFWRKEADMREQIGLLFFGVICFQVFWVDYTFLFFKDWMRHKFCAIRFHIFCRKKSEIDSGWNKINKWKNDGNTKISVLKRGFSEGQ